MLRHLGGLASSLLDTGNSSSAAPTYILESLVPGFGTARSLIWSWTGIDITYIVTWCLLLVFIERGGRYVWEIIYESLILQYCVSTVSIAANERLNDEILSYMSAHVVSRGSRFVAAQSARTGDDRIADPYAYYRHDRGKRLTKEDYDERTPPVKYFPALGTHWFWFRGRPFMFQRGHFTVFSRNTRSLYTEYARGGEPLVIMCFGRHLEPLKAFVQYCKEYAAEAKREMTTIHIKGDKYRYPDTWGQAIARPARALDTINMDEDIKRDIIRDVDAYMDPSAREFYASRGIPFRRGYLFHGPPGTGKTSFSLALAGHCKLDLYMLSLANGSIEEDDLTRMFASLPPRCVVLLEDIDTAGINREAEPVEGSIRPIHRQVSLSGLLNAIDGTSSQEGRLLIMTSNNPDALDKALVRPGRIDKKVYFGPINRASAEQIFIRMFTDQLHGEDGRTITVSANGRITSTEKKLGKDDMETLMDLAKQFAESIPEGKFTPAELQGFLLANRMSATNAVINISDWVIAELANQQKEKERARVKQEAKERAKAEAGAKREKKSTPKTKGKLSNSLPGKIKLDSIDDGLESDSGDSAHGNDVLDTEELIKELAKLSYNPKDIENLQRMLLKSNIEPESEHAREEEKMESEGIKRKKLDNPGQANGTNPEPGKTSNGGSKDERQIASAHQDGGRKSETRETNSIFHEIGGSR
ncbi:P-loop containing nucleoside triphosphate hydrolase protein [Rhizodiscina lignyota]|uniref:P-loop containing nucleoside triphosphate hydrolase protein n=1 Tax=Rhizodiscina lignyota TaxID=1504668 RepID=A0A9P4IFD7_9PEZI|nr:P-loop containing nucleoside triphosphate hydrolase protein [Rhizodiscina lignyota]